MIVKMSNFTAATSAAVFWYAMADIENRVFGRGALRDWQRNLSDHFSRTRLIKTVTTSPREAQACFNKLRI